MLLLIALGLIAGSTPRVPQVDSPAASVLAPLPVGSAEGGVGSGSQRRPIGPGLALTEWEALGGGPDVRLSRADLSVGNGNVRDHVRHGWQAQIPLPAEGARRYLLSCTAFGEGLHYEAEVGARIEALDEFGTPLDAASSTRLDAFMDPSAPAARFEAVLEVPAGSVKLSVQLFLVGGGEARFEGIELRATECAPFSAQLATRMGGYERLARGAAAELDWHFDVESARAEAWRRRRPLLVYVRCVDTPGALAASRAGLLAEGVPLADDGYRKDLLARTGLFADPMIAALLARRVVLLVRTYDLGEHGLSSSAQDPLHALGLESTHMVTPAVALLAPDGRLLQRLHRIGTLGPVWFDRWLRDALDTSELPVPEVAVVDPEELFAAGHLESAHAALDLRFDDQAQLLRARIAARLGDYSAAWNELRGLASAEAELERGLWHLAHGEVAQALPHLDEAREGDLPERAEEAAFWSAWCVARQGRSREARRRYESLAGESAWGRRAAACLIPGGPRLDLVLTPYGLSVPPEGTEATEGVGLFGAAEGPEAGDAPIVRALEFLLGQQAADGTYGSHGGGLGGNFARPTGSWNAGISAWVGLAFHAWRGRVPEELRWRIDDALVGITLALEDWLHAAARAGTAPLELPYVIDFFLASGAQDAALQAAYALVEHQGLDDLWTVYASDRPASFVSALALRSLAHARAAGLSVPGDVLARGARALSELRDESGSFPYSPLEKDRWMTSAHGSVARDPLCELALALGGQGDLALLEAALERFLRYGPELRSATKRTYDAFDLRAHGSYQFFFAHWAALEAARWAGEERGAAVRRSVRERVLAAREFDGTWIDHAMLGRAYGTAAALVILAR